MHIGYSWDMDAELLSPSLPATPSRSVSLVGASNFRDLGGYLTRDGRRLRWGRLYRSAHLAHLTPQDLAALQALGVTRSADFRGLAESQHLSYSWPQLTRHALVVEPTVVQRAQAMLESGEGLTVAATEELMHDTYRSFVQTYSPRFAQFFTLLQQGDAPLVFHCTAGKDRTGWAAALLLTALGVDEEQIMQDYLLTNSLFRRPAQMYGHMSAEVLDVLWRVQPSFLMASVELARAQHGSVDRYLSEALGVDAQVRKRLAELYLEQ